MLQALSKLTTFKTATLKAVLKGVAGFTGGGVVRYVEWYGGRRRLDADLSGIAGVKVEVLLNGAPVSVLPCRDGEAAAWLDTEKGSVIPELVVGDTIEIRQNGASILRGEFKLD
jgi:hypothetical protein